jgi:hypothetical protein
MSRIVLRIFAVSVLLMSGSMQASAQTAEPSESVTVSGNKLREQFHQFLNSFVTPAPFSGKIARWERRICPLVVGQNPEANAFIRQRVKYIALAAGAHINPDAACKPNIEIVFTTTPQALLDNVRQHAMDYLGYAESKAQLQKLATVTRPIEVRYTTESTGYNGMREVDSDILSGVDESMMFLHPIGASSSSGWRINDGIESGFNHILIVVDSTKMAGQKIVPLADYISMLALTQLNSLDACQQNQPSVVNMMATGCDRPVDSLTEYDLAYLQGLYRMSAGRGMMFQRNDIADIMTDRLIGHPIAMNERH